MPIRNTLTPSPCPDGLLGGSRPRISVHQRANESPLTFIRSMPHPRDVPLRSKSWVSYLLYLFEESLACLNRETGAHYRLNLYALLPMLDHEQFDTMALLRVRTYFTCMEDNLPGLSAIVPRHDPAAYAERAYIYLLRNARDPVALISIEHAIEEMLERCPFLRDPTSTWICRPERLHVLLATTNESNVFKETKAGKLIIANSPPVFLKLFKFNWRRDGTLWIQWNCIQGNIDRLRADLRIATRGDFCFSTQDDPTHSRPFAIETLVMALLAKPSNEEFSQLQSVSAEMGRMFAGVVAELETVTRVAQIHDRLDREAINGDETNLAHFPKIDLPHTSFMDSLGTAAVLINTSPSVGRIAAAAGLIITSALAIIVYRKRM